ncbi:MAG: helix-turn-helix transcriptional regulator [Clostridia bacterium]|jgi:transcriptional regulator with XRE-family HTH domain|nr:helix-turn-helix transcriptional regulator [Clostridia bacterium]
MSIRKVHGKFNIVSKNIRKYRLQNNWSQEKLALKLNLLGLPFTKNDIQRIEVNRRIVRDFELIFLAEVFDISISELLSITTSKLNIT